MLSAYIINLSAATDRWKALKRSFSDSHIKLVRIAAVDGMALPSPVPEYSERLYRRYHGRTTNPREIGCYLSHVEACRRFLASGEEHGLICEDDVTVTAAFDQVVEKLLQVSACWDIARLSGLRGDTGVRALRLDEKHWLRINFGRLKGAGAYLINRAAARSISSGFLPMKLPFDHAFDREWCYGLQAVSVSPFPASQQEAGFPTSIQRGEMRKLSSLRRWLTTYPYQIANEISRWAFRAKHLLQLRLGLIEAQPIL